MIDRGAREALIDSLQIGDLVRVNGTLRVVRGLGIPTPKSSRRKDRAYSVTFSIRRCSWTRKPYTVVSRCALYNVPMEVVMRGYGTERGPLDVLLQADCDARGGPSLLECCDVIGVTA